MASGQKPFHKVIWAVSSFVDDASIEKRTAKILSQLVPTEGACVEPVCVFDLSSFDSNFPDPTQAIQKRLNTLKRSFLKPLKVIETEAGIGISISDKVTSLLNYAEKESADLIVVNTAARSGLSRFLMGSFAETLVLHSHIPLLTVNPSLDAPNAIKKILFPTDFSDFSQAALKKVACLAEELNAKLFLFHKLTNPSSLYVGPYGVLTNDLRSLDEEHFNKADTSMKLFETMAEDLGVKVESMIDTSQKPQVESILKQAKAYGVQLVAMAARSGAVEATLLGSTTRKIIRQASCPVWALHP